MSRTLKAQKSDKRFAHETLIRLANSCERAAARGEVVMPIANDLDAKDFRTIAEILRGFAAEIPA